MKAKTLIAYCLPAMLLCTLASHAQTQRVASEAATAEQRLIEDIGVERLPDAAAIRAVPEDGKNISALRQSGNNNAATITQQTLSALNQAYVVQAGNANILTLTQTQGGNLADITQVGSANQVGYSQKGQGNLTSISQKGTGNKIQGITENSDYLLQGDNNVMRISQNGSNNTIKGEVVENRRLYEIRQTGSSNTLTQIETSAQAPKGYIVEMRGQGINLTIEQGKVGH
jgi:minor curlin subunit